MSDQSLDLEIGVKIVCIESSDKDNFEIGSGFVFYQDSDFNYILTCAHVIKAVGGDSQVLVDGYPAVIIAQSSEKSADDLAVLATRKSEIYPIQPLASYVPFLDSKLLDMHFRTKGFYLENKNEMMARLLKGTLSELVNKRVRYQHGHTNVWQLKLDDEYLLEPGYSGSPIVNKVYRVICGVVSQKKGDGRQGFGISIETLENVWQESTNLLRQDIYDLDQIVKLLNSIFHNKESQFSGFCNQHFPEYFDGNLPILPRVAYLVLCCHHFDKISCLLDEIKAINNKEYSKYISRIYVKQSLSKSIILNKNKLSNLCNFFLTKICKKKKKTEDDCETEIIYDYRENLGLEKSIFNQIQLLVIESFATATIVILDISRTQTQILDANPGSIKLRLKLPDYSLDELIKIFQSNRQLANCLGIQYINEILIQPFEIKNIKKLFIQNFSFQEIIEICAEYFPDFYELEHHLLSYNNNSFTRLMINLVTNSKIAEHIIFKSRKETIIEKLILYLSNNSRIEEILDIAREKNSKAYEQCRPYRRVPRRSDRITSMNNVTRWKYVKAAASGFGVSFLYSLLIWTSLFISDHTGLISIIAWVTLPLLGNFVGETVSKNLNNRRSKNIAILAVFSFVGGFLFSLLMLFTIRDSYYSSEGNIRDTILKTLIRLPVFFIVGIILLVVFVTSDLLANLSRNPILLLSVLIRGGLFGIGCRNAYQRAR